MCVYIYIYLFHHLIIHSFFINAHIHANVLSLPTGREFHHHLIFSLFSFFVFSFLAFTMIERNLHINSTSVTSNVVVDNFRFHTRLKYQTKSKEPQVVVFEERGTSKKNEL